MPTRLFTHSLESIVADLISMYRIDTADAKKLKDLGNEASLLLEHREVVPDGYYHKQIHTRRDPEKHLEDVKKAIQENLTSSTLSELANPAYNGYLTRLLPKLTVKWISYKGDDCGVLLPYDGEGKIFENYGGGASYQVPTSATPDIKAYNNTITEVKHLIYRTLIEKGNEEQKNKLKLRIGEPLYKELSSEIELMKLIKKTEDNTMELAKFKEQIGEPLYKKLYDKIIGDHKKLIKNFMKGEVKKKADVLKKEADVLKKEADVLELKEKIGKALYEKLYPEAYKEFLIEELETIVLEHMSSRFKTGEVVYFKKEREDTPLTLVTEQEKELHKEELGEELGLEKLYSKLILEEGQRLKMTIEKELHKEELGERLGLEELYRQLRLEEGQRLKMTIEGGKIKSTIMAPAPAVTPAPAKSGANCAPLLGYQSTRIGI